MNRSFTPRCIPIVTALSFSALVWFVQPAHAIGKPYKNFIGIEDPIKDPATKKSFARNNHSVKIFPDMIKREMHVVARENEGKEIEFFIFDMNGTLIRNHKMKAKEHIRLSGLARGKYRYHVFCGDIETAAGNFVIR